MANAWLPWREADWLDWTEADWLPFVEFIGAYRAAAGEAHVLAAASADLFRAGPIEAGLFTLSIEGEVLQ